MPDSLRVFPIAGLPIKMTDPFVSSTVKIVNPQGMHARPANLVATCASEFSSKIEIIKDGNRVDAKSILSLMTLAAEQGSELSIEATGSDAAVAVNALVELVQNGFGDVEAGVQGGTQESSRPGTT